MRLIQGFKILHSDSEMPEPPPEGSHRKAAECNFFVYTPVAVRGAKKCEKSLQGNKKSVPLQSQFERNSQETQE